MEEKHHGDRRHSLDPTAASKQQTTLREKRCSRLYMQCEKAYSRLSKLYFEVTGQSMIDMLNQGRRVSFSGNDEHIPYQPQNRRHSVMILPNQQLKRMSIDPRHQRRTSRRFSILPLQEFSTTTFSGLPLQIKPVLEVENTYKLLPDPGTEFKAHVVRKETEKIVDRVLQEINYMTSEEKKQLTIGNSYFIRRDERKGGKLAKQLVSEVKDQLKTLNMERYKLVVNAFVGTNCGQGMVIASRSLWNTDTDGHITVVRKNAKKYAIVTVHAAYYE